MRADLRRAARRLPSPVRRAIVEVAGFPRVRRILHRPRWGNLRRARPFSERYGVDRGSAIDRYYIDRFVAEHAADIRGHVLEVAEGRYARVHPSAIEVLDVLDIDPRNDQATVIADLDDAGSLPPGAYDCVVLTQTLQYVFEPEVALTNLWDSLAPGGVLLLSVPITSKVDHDLADRDSWRMLAPGLGQLLQRSCVGAEVTLVTAGNLVATIAFLLGLAAEELRPDELDGDDPLHPLVTCARVRRPSA